MLPHIQRLAKSQSLIPRHSVTLAHIQIRTESHCLTHNFTLSYNNKVRRLFTVSRSLTITEAISKTVRHNVQSGRQLHSHPVIQLHYWHILSHCHNGQYSDCNRVKQWYITISDTHYRTVTQLNAPQSHSRTLRQSDTHSDTPSVTMSISQTVIESHSDTVTGSDIHCHTDTQSDTYTVT